MPAITAFCDGVAQTAATGTISAKWKEHYYYWGNYNSTNPCGPRYFLCRGKRKYDNPIA